VIALVALLGAPFLAGLDAVWPLLLFFLGFILLMVELLIIPGFGAFGIIGLICMFVGLVMQIVPTPGRNLFNLPSREAAADLEASLLWMTAAAAGSLVGLIYLFKSFESIPVLNRMILREGGPLPAEAIVDAIPVSGAEVIGGGSISVGAVGRVVAELHPTGRAEIDGQIIDVVTPGNLIALGQSVCVIEVHGNRIVVDAVEAG
jgi:membrane-bound serine protease (ClpP class)